MSEETEKVLRNENERLTAEVKQLRERIESLEFDIKQREAADRNFDSRERGRYS
jgi:hypothetical protein